MDAKTDGTPSPEIVAWAPGDDGKGFLTRGNSRRLEIWKTDENTFPHHADGVAAFGVDLDEVAVFFKIYEGELTVYSDDVDGRPSGEVIRELDPRIPPDRPETEFVFG